MILKLLIAVLKKIIEIKLLIMSTLREITHWNWDKNKTHI